MLRSDPTRAPFLRERGEVGTPQQKQSMKHKKQKLVSVVIRGCVVRVPATEAPKLAAAERELTRTDWNRNRID